MEGPKIGRRGGVGCGGQGLAPSETRRFWTWHGGCWLGDIVEGWGDPEQNVGVQRRVLGSAGTGGDVAGLRSGGGTLGWGRGTGAGSSELAEEHAPSGGAGCPLDRASAWHSSRGGGPPAPRAARPPGAQRRRRRPGFGPGRLRRLEPGRWPPPPSAAASSRRRVRAPRRGGCDQGVPARRARWAAFASLYRTRWADRGLRGGNGLPAALPQSRRPRLGVGCCPEPRPRRPKPGRAGASQGPERSMGENLAAQEVCPPRVTDWGPPISR